MLYIGVDLGTSAVKLLLMEGNGKISYRRNIRFIFRIRDGLSRSRRIGMSRALRALRS